MLFICLHNFLYNRRSYIKNNKEFRKERKFTMKKENIAITLDTEVQFSLTKKWTSVIEKHNQRASYESEYGHERFAHAAIGKQYVPNEKGVYRMSFLELLYVTREIFLCAGCRSEFEGAIVTFFTDDGPVELQINEHVAFDPADIVVNAIQEREPWFERSKDGLCRNSFWATINYMRPFVAVLGKHAFRSDKVILNV